MRALVKAEAKEGLVLREEPIPQIGPDDILIKVAKTGICGTDLHIWKWDQWAQKTIPVPMVVGHEYAGVVTEIGSHVRTVKVGDRVSGEGHLIGMKSRMARAGHFHLDPETKGVGVNVPGAFAEYLKLPMPSICRLKLTMRLAPSLIPSAMRFTPPCPLISSVRMC
jgi:threonine 3-dehydrogenase